MQREGRIEWRAAGFLCALRVQFFDVLHQLILVRHPAEIETDHFIRAERGFFARPKSDQHACNDCEVRLDLNTVLVVAQQVATAQNVLERTEKYLTLPSIMPPLSQVFWLSLAFPSYRHRLAASLAFWFRERFRIRTVRPTLLCASQLSQSSISSSSAHSTQCPRRSLSFRASTQPRRNQLCSVVAGMSSAWARSARSHSS